PWPAGWASSSSTPGPCTAPWRWRPCAAASTWPISRRSERWWRTCAWRCGRAGCCSTARTWPRPFGLPGGRGRRARWPTRAGCGRRVVELQRELAGGRDGVCEGRARGTVVFPDAGCKFSLVAAPAERARRRQREMAARGEEVDLAAVRAAQEARDRRDAARG